MYEEEKINMEKREVSWQAQKREMQMELQKWNEREGIIIFIYILFIYLAKRRKVNSIQQQNIISKPDNNFSLQNIKNKLSNCVIF